MQILDCTKFTVESIYRQLVIDNIIWNERVLTEVQLMQQSNAAVKLTGCILSFSSQFTSLMRLSSFLRLRPLSKRHLVISVSMPDFHTSLQFRNIYWSDKITTRPLHSPWVTASRMCFKKKKCRTTRIHLQDCMATELKRIVQNTSHTAKIKWLNFNAGHTAELRCNTTVLNSTKLEQKCAYSNDAINMVENLKLTNYSLK